MTAHDEARKVLAAFDALPIGREEDGMFNRRELREWVNKAVRVMRECAEENKAQAKRIETLEQVVAKQAEDDGLWFVATTASEEYLQAALRYLHATIEGDTIMADLSRRTRPRGTQNDRPR